MADLAKGPKVTELQRRLNENGAKPKLKVDGVFAPKEVDLCGLHRARETV